MRQPWQISVKRRLGTSQGYYSRWVTISSGLCTTCYHCCEKLPLARKTLGYVVVKQCFWPTITPKLPPIQR